MCTSELPNLDVRFEINDCFNEVLSLYTREIFLSIKILKGLKHKKTQVVTFFFFRWNYSYSFMLEVFRYATDIKKACNRAQ